MNCVLEWLLKNKKIVAIVVLVIIVILVIVLTTKKENIESPEPSPSGNCLVCELDKCGIDGDSYCNNSCTKFKLSSGKQICVRP